jgi:hypothetical protein
MDSHCPARSISVLVCGVFVFAPVAKWIILAQMDFMYQSQKLSEARHALMLPHPRGEAESIAGAFALCSLGFHVMKTDGLDDNARRWVSKIQEMMDTSGIDDSEGRGKFLVKAERFSTDEKIELSRTVNELAHWFDMKFWEAH